MTTTSTAPCSDQPYLHMLEDVKLRPVFIMGHPRSGTTVLYHLLSLTGCFNWVNVYHILRADQLLANRVNGREEAAYQEMEQLFQSFGLDTRQFDNVPVGPTLPEEYLFYLHPRTGTMKLVPKGRELFTEFCQKVQFVSQPDNPLLLKNPMDYPNFLYLREVFPNARFIFNHRNPVHTLNSQYKGLRGKQPNRNEYQRLLSKVFARMQDSRVVIPLLRKLFFQNTRFQPLLSYLIARMAKAEGYYHQHIAELPPESYTSLRYEDLCADPETAVRRILDFLELEPRNPIDYRKQISPRVAPLAPQVDRVRAKIYRRLQPTFAAHAYPPETG